MSPEPDDPTAIPLPDDGGADEARIQHWLDHAVATLWFISHAPRPDGGEWSYDDAYDALALICGTLRYLGDEFGDERARLGATKVFEVLELFAKDVRAAKRQAPQAAAEISSRQMQGYWPGE
jgi:hypothetical protein